MGNFYTDVIMKDKRFLSVDSINDPMLLEPATRSAVMRIIALAAAKGVQLVVGETYRSTTRQLHLFNTKKTELKNVGVHHYGLACDLWIEHHDNKPDWKANYMQLGPLAAAARVVWGYDWGTPKAKHSFRDIDHIQRVTIKRQDALFAGHWYPPDGYDPLTELGVPLPKLPAPPKAAVA